MVAPKGLAVNQPRALLSVLYFSMFISIIIFSFFLIRSNSNEFLNPLLKRGYSSYNITLSQSNRCMQYPRCILFDCCDNDLKNHVQDYFFAEEQRSGYHSFSCMKSQSCSYRASLSDRMSDFWALKETFTHDILVDALVSLPPTSPAIYKFLENRTEFKILYLVQGDYKNNLPSWYSELEDFLYLSYKVNYDDSLYYPSSNLCHGRMALYLTGRLLEIRQGWLYNYFVFMDDDAIKVQGSLHNWETQLSMWLPAVASPVYDRSYSRNTESTSHVDFIMIAYHREVLEVLHPWIFDFDSNCTWASQLMQSLEMAIAYRNHVLYFASLRVQNDVHRGYPKACLGPGEGFSQAIHNHYHSIPIALRHCALRDLQDFEEKFEQMAIIGIALPKIRNYHLMDHISPFYPSTTQRFCHNLTAWNSSDRLCCTIDATEYYMYAPVSAPRVHVVPTVPKYQSSTRPYITLLSLDVPVIDTLLLQVGYHSVDISNRWELAEELDNDIPFSYSTHTDDVVSQAQDAFIY